MSFIHSAINVIVHILHICGRTRLSVSSFVGVVSNMRQRKTNGWKVTRERFLVKYLTVCKGKETNYQGADNYLFVVFWYTSYTFPSYWVTFRKKLLANTNASCRPRHCTEYAIIKFL
jgi:hypothetical protein